MDICKQDRFYLKRTAQKAQCISRAHKVISEIQKTLTDLYLDEKGELLVCSSNETLIAINQLKIRLELDHAAYKDLYDEINHSAVGNDNHNH